ncbi:MAG TPA: nucleoside monophosphate kinase [Candidatus Nanoarchaeia archaeon]|nr:nucleoside monophosphate kinase [Candidatus Nanoarchaeia archaeon]
MKLIILGPPGSGKGTQARLLKRDLKLKHISSDILRNEIKKKTKLGKIFEKYINRGDLVPDHLINPLIKKHIPKDNFIIDGYPRRVGEAKYLDNYCRPDHVIFLDVPKNALIKRLLKRAKIEGRKDDTLDIIKERFRVYEKETKPVIKHYKNKMIKITGNKKPEIVEKELLKILNNENRNSKTKP